MSYILGRSVSLTVISISIMLRDLRFENTLQFWGPQSDSDKNDVGPPIKNCLLNKMKLSEHVHITFHVLGSYITYTCTQKIYIHKS